MPEWIKNLPTYYDGNPSTQHKTQTAKRCIPLLDAVMFGYTIVLTEDIGVEQKLDGAHYEWKVGRGFGSHELKQYETHSAAKTHPHMPKWFSPWSIETPAGYSCLFVAPLNHDDLPFQAFTGVVDTDKYIDVVNFPFMLRDPNFNGVLEAGTPIVQVIPFKRDEWNMQVHSGTTNRYERFNRLANTKFKNAYRRLFHSPKSFN